MRAPVRKGTALLLLCCLFCFTSWRNETLIAKLNFAQNLMQQAIAEVAPIVLPEEEGSSGVIYKPPVPDVSGNYSDFNASVEPTPELEATICNGMNAMQEEIDLSSYNLIDTEMKAVMSHILFSHPELFFVGNAYNFKTVGDRVTTLHPTYLYTQGEVYSMNTTYQLKLQTIVDGAPADGTEFDKILYLHDYFVREFTYDDTLTIRDAYTLFTEKTGVCQAYMLGLIAACEAMGIESTPVTSDEMKHAWNQVKIDGKWYHVDFTWDDSDAVVLNSATCYTYFLRSDGYMYEEDGHRAWSASQAADSTLYDAANWRQLKTPMVKSGEDYYYMVSEQVAGGKYRGVICRDNATGSAPVGCVEIANYYWRVADEETSCYPGCYAGIGVWGDYIVYTTPNTVYSWNEAKGSQLLAVLDTGGRWIYGIVGIVGDVMTYELAYSPTDSKSITATVTLVMT